MDTFDVIFTTYSPLVFRYLRSLCGDAAVAEELTAETFYRAYTHFDSFRGDSKLETWLCAIAKNQYFFYMKKHVRMQADSDVDRMVAGAGITEVAMSAEQEVMQQVGQMELLKKLHVFPEPGREVLYLRMFGNLSFREIGEVMGKTENWARVTFFRARTNLRKELEKDEK